MNEKYSIINIIDESYKITKLNPGIRVSFKQRIEKLCELINPNHDCIVLNGTGETALSINMVCAIIQKLKLTPEQTKIILNVDPKDFSENNLLGYDVTVDRTANFCNWYNFYNILSTHNINWKNITLEHYILSLANRPTIERALYTKDVIDIFKENALASFGVGGKITKQMQDILEPYQTPMVIDINRKNFQNSYFHLDTHQDINPKMFSCLFKLVLETTVEHLFISEKTFKAFAWHQIPIFVASEQHTRTLKDLGFDVFDDLFYELLGYNLYNTPATQKSFRIKVKTLLLKIRQKYPTLAHIEDLRNSVWERLLHNNSRLSYYVKNDITKGMITQ